MSPSTTVSSACHHRPDQTLTIVKLYVYYNELVATLLWSAFQCLGPLSNMRIQAGDTVADNIGMCVTCQRLIVLHVASRHLFIISLHHEK
jgi:hypothetical protein